MQRVVDGEDRAAGQAEDVGDAEQLERADDRLAPVMHGRAWRCERVAGRMAGADSVVMVDVPVLMDGDVGKRRHSARGRALRGGAHELGVLGEDATGIARGKRRPAIAAGASSASSTSRSRERAAISTRIRSPSRTKAMGPASTASGAMWPMHRPVVPPENRPSVKSSTSFPSPAPLMAAVIASISRMPGPPFGPS